MIEDDCDDIDAADRAAWFARQDAYDLSPEGIAEQNRLLLRRYDDFRKAAETVAGAWQRRHPEVAGRGPDWFGGKKTLEGSAPLFSLPAGEHQTVA